MIKSALMALGLTASGFGAGAAQAQGLVATAPILETCGGLKITLEPMDGGGDAAALDRAGDVVSVRMGGVFSQIFDYTIVQDGAIVVSLPRAFGDDLAPLEPLLQQVKFGFHDIDRVVLAGDTVSLDAGQILLPDASDETRRYVLNAVPVLDGGALVDAQPSFDYNNQPAVTFRFSDEGAAIFGDYTANNIGKPFAIVLQDKVMSAPTIQTAITGGEGIITGLFTVEEATALAVSMRSGVMPFSLEVLAVETMDGSDPSAAFCP